MATARRFPKLTFVFGALCVSYACRLIVGSPSFAANPGPLSWAVLADLTITVPALYYFLVVRRGAASAMTLVPIVLLGFLRARTLLPSEHLARLHGIEFLAGGLEVFLLGFAASKVIRLKQEYRKAGLREPAFADAFPTAMCGAFGNSRLVDLLVSEVLTVYYALVARRSGQAMPKDAVPFTSHRRVGWGAIVAALGMVTVVESAALHFLVQQWSKSAAWVLTGLSAYGVLWLVGDFRAMGLRPTFLTRHSFYLRVGLRWQVEIPLSLIQAVREYSKNESSLPSYSKLTVLGEPRLVIELTRPVEIKGLFGIRRSASRLGVSMDDGEFTPLLERFVLATRTNSIVPSSR